jgi:signal transduction histidine kinase
MQVKSLERSMPDDQKSGDELERIYTTLDGFLDEIQGVTEELMPRILSDAGLVAAMEWQMKDLHRRTGIDTYVQSDLGGIVISEALSTFIYRVFQEAIQNMVQHSRALRAEALLSIEDGFLTLSIIDNDRGISRAELANPESLGLLWMKERAKHFGGSVEISERPRKGTEVILRIPISSV